MLNSDSPNFTSLTDETDYAVKAYLASILRARTSLVRILYGCNSLQIGRKVWEASSAQNTWLIFSKVACLCLHPRRFKWEIGACSPTMFPEYVQTSSSLDSRLSRDIDEPLSKHTGERPRTSGLQTSTLMLSRTNVIYISITFIKRDRFNAFNILTSICLPPDLCSSWLTTTSRRLFA